MLEGSEQKGKKWIVKKKEIFVNGEGVNMPVPGSTVTSTNRGKACPSPSFDARNLKNGEQTHNMRMFCCDASMADSLVRCIFVVLHLWCYVYALLVCYALASLVCWIIGALQLWWIISWLQYFFGVLHLRCIASLVLCMHFWYAMHRHLWWCPIGAISIVISFLGLGCNISLVFRLWCYALSATSLLQWRIYFITNSLIQSFEKHHYIALQETCDPWNMWSEWWGDCVEVLKVEIYSKLVSIQRIQMFKCVFYLNTIVSFLDGWFREALKTNFW